MTNRIQVRASADDRYAGHSAPSYPWWLIGHLFKEPEFDAADADRAREKQIEGAPERGVEFVRHATIDELTDHIVGAIRRDLAKGLTPYGLEENSDELAVFNKAREAAKAHHASVHEHDDEPLFESVG